MVIFISYLPLQLLNSIYRVLAHLKLPFQTYDNLLFLINFSSKLVYCGTQLGILSGHVAHGSLYLLEFSFGHFTLFFQFFLELSDLFLLQFNLLAVGFGLTLKSFALFANLLALLLCSNLLSLEPLYLVLKFNL